ncbi:DUF3189 family protein [Bacillus sp. DNRA2]|uniref:DUF3189 family protein n=1 Tax=Bacillus sp. DNRA2 TaxID=2723053 RepID=UPI00145E2900|nr:DUF3189 family protein [Bacillus sp. DNRA2]NMD71193.1 DUF3189 family protein [Bacillus sp. DNRA2]
MIFIYHDFGGTHSTSLAAAYHLKILDNPEKILSKEEVLAVPFFNKLKKKDAGKIFFHGKDQEGNSVYTIGRRSSKLVIPSLLSFCEIMFSRQQLNEKIIFSNTSPVVPFAMTMGGFFSRGLGINVIGVPLLVKGAQQCCKHVSQLVEETKETARTSEGQRIISIENKKFQA